MCKKVMDPETAHWMERVLIQNGIDVEAGMFFAYTVLFMVRDCARPKECDSALRWLETVGAKLMPILGLEPEGLLAEARRNHELAKAKLPGVRPARKRKTYFRGTAKRSLPRRPRGRSPEIQKLREQVRYKLRTHTLLPQHATGR